MATIVKRGTTYSVVYSYKNENGEFRQKWTSGLSKYDAGKLKAEIELKKKKGTLITPTEYCVSDMLDDYIEHKVERMTWSINYYAAVLRQVVGYIKPSFLGEMRVQDVRPKDIDRFYAELLTTPRLKQPPNGAVKYVSANGVGEIHKVLRPAFDLAVKNEYAENNPTDKAEKPKHIALKREIWDEEQIAKALNRCTEPTLWIAMHIAFSCTLREGESSGLTWDCVDLENLDMASLTINKTLCRISKEGYEKLNGRGVIQVFESPIRKKEETRTILVLKEPQTASSIRKVYIPRTLALILRQWKAQQERLKELKGPDYWDYNLVIALENGRPVENRVMENYLHKLIAKESLPKVCFHSLRHSSITYKLVLSNGNVKAVQGDSGHSQARVLMQTYAHIMDKNRIETAQAFEGSFYSGRQEALANKTAETAVPVSAPTETDIMLEQLKQNPELLAALVKAAGLLATG